MKKKLQLLLMTAVFSVLLAVTAFAATEPAKVEGLKQVDASNSSIQVSWNAVLGQNIHYEISMSTDGINWIVEEDSTTLTNYSDYNLSSGKTYYLRVRAFVDDWLNPEVYGAYSDVIQVTTAPNKVTNTKQIGATTSTVTIQWDMSEGATAYQVCRYQDNVETVIGTTTGTKCTIKGMNNKIQCPFYIYVRPIRAIEGYTAVDKTAWYSVSSIAPYQVKLLPAKVTNIYIAYDWSTSKEIVFKNDTVKYAEGYVYELYNYKNKKLRSGTASTYSTTLKNMTKQFYKLRIRPYTTINNKVLYGEWSEYLNFAPQPVVDAKLAGKKVKLSWKKVKGAKNYSVYMSAKQESGYKKLATTKKASFKVAKFKKKKLKKNKTYYLYVVANRKVGKKTFKSCVLSVKWIKIY